jgi:LmbE family N-acetylglucosaminyl deacetylase
MSGVARVGWLRRVLRALHARAGRSGRAAGLRLELELLPRGRAPAIVRAPAERRVLVLAPHMDDEVIGCGGTLALCATAGADVRVVYLTDGSKGYADATPPGLPLRDDERELVATRKEEARRAAKILGLSELLFLGLPDGALAQTPQTVELLARVLAKARPELVLLPFLSDLHPDHVATGAIFVAAAREAGLAPGTPCWGYEVWCPLPANALVEIGAAMERKRAALQEFASQLGDVDYARACEGLARYRSLLTRGGRGHAEAFFTADLALYSRLHALARAAR